MSQDNQFRGVERSERCLSCDAEMKEAIVLDGGVLWECPKCGHQSARWHDGPAHCSEGRERND